MLIRKFLLGVCVMMLLATAGRAQNNEPPATDQPAYIHPETPEQRRTRIGTADDPGPDPDPSKHFWRFGQSYHIEKVPRRMVGFDAPLGFVKPSRLTPLFDLELYQATKDYVWVWAPDNPVPTAEQQPEDKYDDRTYAFLNRIRSEFAPLTPPSSGKTIHFRESSSGLPTSGSWRSSLAVADMNEDGCPDIITPPERKGSGAPFILLGDCKGNWKLWTDMKFPHGIDYGGVAVADFNKDGHMDLVFGVHLQGIYVFLGDGKGNFTEVTKGLPRDFPTRRVIATDVDHDGYPDIVAINEGPTQGALAGREPLHAYLNRNKGMEWQTLPISPYDAKLGGEWLSEGNFNGDSYPDFLASSVYYGSMDVVYLSSGAKKWKKLESTGELLPSMAYYFANTAGHFSSRRRDDAILSYIRYWPGDANPSRVRPPDSSLVSAIDRVVFANGKPPHREPIFRVAGSGGFVGLATGDFDGDKNTDLVYVTGNPRSLGILLGDGHGGFRTAQVDGITLASNPIYDVKVADVNNDGRPDIIVMYEAGGNAAGSIHVYLNTGTDTVAPQTAK